MSSTHGISSDQELRDLEHKLIEVFADAQDGIKANSFWTCFYNKHRFYPDQKKFGCHKRSELLDLFPDLFVTVENSKKERILTIKEKVLADENNSGSEAIRCSGQKQQVEKAKRAKELSKTESTQSDECSAAVYGTEMSDSADNKATGHKQPDFHRFYKRQNADPYQKGNIPCNLQQNQAANALPAPFYVGVAAPPLMPSYSFINTKHLLQQNQAYPHQLQGFPDMQSYEGPLQAGSISMPLNANQNNNMVGGHDFPPVGSSSSRVTASSGKSFEISNRAQRPVEKHSTGATSAKRTNITRDQMNTVADDCIERLSESKEYVSLERIEKLFLQHYSANSLAQLSLRHLEELACVNEHIRRECRVNLYIQMFIKTRAICTVHELSQCLKEFAPNRQEFETLRLGPLNKMPLVYQIFLVPPNKEICEIETADVLEYLRCFLTDNDLWTSHNVTIEDFLKYMMEKRGLSTPYELGVRLKSLPLGIQVLKKGQRDCGSAIRDAVARLKAVVENDIGTAFHYFTTGMFHKEPGICRLRQEYLSMPFVDVVNSFFAKLTKLYRVVAEQEASWELSTNVPGTAKARRREINKTQATLSELKSLLNRDILLQKLMHIAICCSEEQIHQQLRELFIKKDIASSDKPQNDPGPENIPKKDELIATVNKYMERCIAHGPLTLDKLSKIEERIIEDFQLKHFSSLNQGHFLHFLLNSEPVHKLLDESGGTLLGSSHAVSAESCYHPNVEDLLDFITQCTYKDPLQHKFIEVAMCYHYSVKDVKFLGHGHFTNLMKMVEKQQRPNRNCGVLYAGTLVAKQFPTALAPDRSTGLLGHMTKEKALACLQSCPLLEDLALWSQWDLVFKPELRELKDFLQKYGGAQITTVTEGESKKTLCTNILALEVRPGTLLKLTGDTSPELFAKAAAAKDVSGTCGHLVSLIAVNCGTENTPLALLDNSFRAALLQIHASQPNEIGTYNFKKERDVSVDIARFVLDCIVRVPLVIGHHVVNQVFLQGLNFVIGQTKSKELLLQCAQTAEHRSHLQALGTLLGIKEWEESFCERLTPPPGCIKEIDSNLTDIVAEEESSEADEGSISESEFSLSDDDKNDSEDGNETDNDKEVDLKGDDIQQKKKIASQKLIVADTEKDQTEPVTTLDESDDEIFKECVDKPAAEEDVKDTLSDFERPDFEDKAAIEATTSAAVTESEKEQKCQNLINEIRQEEFGFNVELNEDGTRLLTKQQERLGRSLERLSKDLYSKDTHFVLELIQNADDNEYPEDMMSSQLDPVPSVQFIVNRDSIIVYNNEVGFKEKNIRAICDVGRTTKGKHKFGYIGQKGIGFKSVFRITDTPEIHSNGYHIRFDANSKPLGYILPSWLNKDQHSVELSELWTTCIALPLKWEMKEQMHSLSLAARFRDIRPSLLLFLHRLRSIEIINEVEGYMSKMRRNDIGEGVTEIEHQNGVDRWLVVRKTLDASQISLQAKSGIEVESTEISLAFPMISKEMIAAKVLPERQPVFAFLPLRSYGFRFIIQGDFDVPSSREEVDRDSMWNQWLRNEVHHVFVNALEVFKSHSEFDPVEAVSYFLQFVPNTDEILDFFLPVAANILNQLKAKPCLPSQGLLWKLPSQLLICGDSLVHEIVSDSLLRQHLGLDYLHREVEACMNPPLLESLGVQTLTTHHLIEVGKSIVSSLNSPESEDISRSIIMISKWLLCISRSMDEFSDNNDILAILRAFPMILLTNGKVVSLESQTVFFPLSTLEKEATRINLLRRLESDMQTVHPLLLGPPEDISSLKIMLFLQQLGVKKLTPYEVIQHHILPALKSPDAEDKPRDLLMVYLLYIKEHFNSQHSMLDMNEIKEAAVLLTNHGPKRPHLVSVHFTEAYDNRFSLKQLLPGYPWILVDSCYLHGSQFISQVLEWKEFLKGLGVLDFLAVKQRKVVMKPPELADSPWSLCKESLPDLDEYHILDSECEEFESLVKCNKELQSLMDQMKFLFELLDANWDAYYKRHAVTQITNSQGVPLKEVATSFGNLLVSLQWIPSRFEKTCQLAKGCDLFVSTPETEKLMASHVSYIIPKVLIKSSFAQHLGIKHTIGVEFVAGQLLKWSARCENELQKPTLFDSSLNHLRNVYDYLADNLPRKRIQELFDHPVIFYPPMTPKEKGHFLAKHEVRWSDPSGLFEEYREDLLPEEGSGNAFRVTIDFLYHEQRPLFLEIARVQLKPDVGDYIELLIQMSSMMPLQKVLRDVLIIYSLVGRELMETNEQSSGMMKEKLIALMKQSKAIPGKNGCWIGLDNKTLIADDKQLEKLFSSSEVDFIECGEKLGIGRARVNKGLEGINLDFVIKFLTSLGVEKLSSCVDIKSQTEMYQPCPALQRYVREVVPFIQRMVYCFPTIYDFLVSKKDIKNKLANMQFAQVAKLELIHSLINLPHVPPVIFPQKCRLLNDQEMYVHRDSVSAHNDINRELARYFSCIGIPCPDDVAQCSDACFTKLKSFLGEILPHIQTKSSAIDEVLDEHNLLAFPGSEEPLWEVKEPIVIATYPQRSGVGHSVKESLTDNTLESADGEEIIDDGSSSTGLKSWPPQAPSARIHSGAKTGTQPNPLMWPPPAPAQYMDHANLPSNIRPSDLEREPVEEVSVGEVPHGDNEDSLQRQPVPMKEAIAENFKTPSGSTGKARVFGSTENLPKLIWKPGQEGDVPDNEPKVESSVGAMPDPAPAEAPRPLRHDTTTPADVDSRLPVVRSNSNVDEPMVIEFSLPSTEANALAQAGHKRTRVSSGPSSNEFVLPRTRQLITSHFYGPPIWLAQTDENVFVDLELADELLIPQNINLSEDPDTTVIGVWGEALVRNFLEKYKLQNGSDDIIEIIHVNQELETGKPYDFLVRRQLGDSVSEVYIEVKTTISSSKACFQISFHQLMFAYEMGPNYHLYRVFSAGNPNEVRLAKIENLLEKLVQEKVKLMMII